MPPQMQSTPLPRKEMADKEAIFKNRYEAHQFSDDDNMDKSAAYVAYGDAAVSLMENAGTEHKSAFAANIILGPNALARDMAYEILIKEGKNEDLAYIIAHTHDKTILEGITKKLLSLPDLTVRDIALAIGVVSRVRVVYTKYDNMDLRQKIFEELCKKGRQINGDEFVKNVAVALAFPTRYHESEAKAFDAFASRSAYDEQVIAYLADNARFVLGEDSKFALEIQLSVKKEKLAKLEGTLGLVRGLDAPESLVKEFEKFIEEARDDIAELESRIK